MKNNRGGITGLAVLMIVFSALRLGVLVLSAMGIVPLGGVPAVETSNLFVLIAFALLALFSLITAVVVLTRRAQGFCKAALVVLFVLGIASLVLTFSDSEVWRMLLNAAVNAALPGLLYAALFGGNDRKALKNA